MEVCKSQRLTIRQFKHDDAEFVLTLLNEQTFIENIGDKNVLDINGAVEYLSNGPMASYEKYGFGLYLV
ncbi:MAG: GNAT family N-acetyltransferase, partial [Shewanella sp.]|nr:GNAT family N-acetyltransferase [Shewanella sp.]